MALPMLHLLRLPPSLRRQVLTNASLLLRPLETQSPTIRLSIRRSYAQTNPPPKPTRRKANPLGRQEPPAPATRPAATRISNPYADRLCHNTDIVLLYNSPRHSSYRIWSYICGAISFLGGVSTALLVKDESSDSTNKDANAKRVPWFVRLSVSSVALMFAVMGTIFVLGPSKIIRRIWLVKNQRLQPSGGSTTRHLDYFLRLETKSMLPFRAGRTIESDISNFSIDRDVHAQQNLYWNNVPLSSSDLFTSWHQNHPTPPSLGMAGRLMGINAAILNAWPATKREVRRMFLRDGFAYVYVVGEDGQWKLDLQGAEVLDRGRPLEKLMQTDERMPKGPMVWLQRVISAINQR